MEPAGTKTEITKEIAAFWLLIRAGSFPIALSVKVITNTRKLGELKRKKDNVMKKIVFPMLLKTQQY